MHKGYKRHIDWKKNPSVKIWQIYKQGIEFAFLSNEGQQCNQFVWCKDFLQDMIYATLHNKTIDIYQFKYDPNHDPQPCLKKIRLLVANANDSKFKIKIFNSLDMINQVEEKLGIKKSIVRECWLPPEKYKKSGVWLFEGSKRWLNAPPMLSLYSLLIRVGFAHKIGTNFEKTIEEVANGQLKPYQKRDATWLKHARPGIEKILRIGDRKIFFRDIKNNYPAAKKVDVIHNRLGINSFANEMQNQSTTVPYWHSLK